MGKPSRTAFYTSAICLQHDMGKDNPECPLRLEKIEELMLTTGLDMKLIPMVPPKAAYIDLLAAHDPDYLQFLSHSSPQSGVLKLNLDTSMNPYTWEAAQIAAGAGVDAVDRILDGQFDKAFCAVRPPGHHAHRDHSGGFCFLNNVAIAALHALKIKNLDRVAIIDFDVHHGDGTSDILGGNDKVLIVDSFQDGLFPYAHKTTKPSNALYTPFTEGMGGEELMVNVDKYWEPAVKEFQPDMIFVSAGFDGHREEDQAQLLMVESNYAFIARRLVQWFNEIPNCKGIVCLLEGGYCTSSLARSCVAFLRQLSASGRSESMREDEAG